MGKFSEQRKLELYRQQMGEAKTDKQTTLAAKARGNCCCLPVKVKTDGGVRVIHDQTCPKWKTWMQDLVPSRPVHFSWSESVSKDD